MNKEQKNTCNIKDCTKKCFYREKSEQYKNTIEELQKEIIGNMDLMNPLQDNVCKYNDDPLLYVYKANNKYIMNYIKSLKHQNSLYLAIIIVLLIFNILNIYA